MSENKRLHVQNYFTIKETNIPNEVSEGTEYGEIVVMATKDNEKLFIKNSNNEMVSFPSLHIVNEYIGQATKDFLTVGDVREKINENNEYIDGKYATKNYVNNKILQEVVKVFRFVGVYKSLPNPDEHNEGDIIIVKDEINSTTREYVCIVKGPIMFDPDSTIYDDYGTKEWVEIGDERWKVYVDTKINELLNNSDQKYATKEEIENLSSNLESVEEETNALNQRISSVEEETNAEFKRISDVIIENELITASALSEIKKDLISNVDKRIFEEVFDNSFDILDNKIYYMNTQFSTIYLNVDEIKYGCPYILLIKSKYGVNTSIKINNTSVFWSNGRGDITRDLETNESYFEIQFIKYNESTPWFGVWTEYIN